MGETAQILRVVVASPSDVQAERNCLPTVIDDINRDIARGQGLRLELLRWETDTYPGFHPDGPQGLIDPILRVEDCDVLIGIFWKRFGTPTMEAQSGTEHEFRRAYAAWQQHQRPHIMVYFNHQPYMPQRPDELDQWRQVLEFRQEFPKEGLWWPYRGKNQFERLVRHHLTQFLRSWQAQAAVAPSESAQDKARSVSPSSGLSPTLRDAYLTWLMAQVRAVPLIGVDRDSILEETRRDLDLAAVYMALMTQRLASLEERTLSPGRDIKALSRALSALEVLNAEPRLALLGDPGSGKSTFVNFVALCLAGELLGQKEANLAVLRSPVPEDDDTSEDDAYGRAKEETRTPQPWDHGPLLPIRVVLREFVARGLPPTEQPAEITSDTLWQFIVAELPEQTLREVATPLQSLLRTDGGLLLLDGLDEVPEADHRRDQVKAAIEQFVAVFPRVRVLVTSRTYAYQQQNWKLAEFAEAVLAPFTPVQIHSFVERWYAFVGQVRGLRADESQGRARLLNQAIQHSERLQEFATRPLLLTLIASLHAWRGGSLPEQREELYEEAVRLLLDLWERQKSIRQLDGTYAVVQPSLREWLRLDQQAMRQALNRLAFESHRNQASLVGTADIAEGTLVEVLVRLHQDLDVRPGRLIEHLSTRTGLLESRGVGIYTFPHRTFQEYLAACHLTDDDFPDKLATLLHSEPSRWREVTLLAGAKAARGTKYATWDLAEALCFKDPPRTPAKDAAGYWGALLAAQVLLENRALAMSVGARHQPKMARIRAWLVRTLQHGVLPARERAQAGDALVQCGDPRFRANAWYLPDEPLLGFVEIPAGPFLMGSNTQRDALAYNDELPQHKVVLPTFYMARYPVTVAQFRAFVDASGYVLTNRQSLDGVLNHPIVWVDWSDTLAYCNWLTQCLREWSGTPAPLATLLHQPGGCVTLPSEAEWEKAARGTDGRLYPWGKEPDSDRANYHDTGVGATSPVGCFPKGASPYGVEDLSGNAWEWTRSTEGKYPYPQQKTARAQRESLQSSHTHAFRVLRGGAFWGAHQDVRCAARNWSGPYASRDFTGFRVVVAVLP